MVEHIRNFVILGCLGITIEIFFSSIRLFLQDKSKLGFVGFSNIWMFFIYGVMFSIVFPMVHDVIGEQNWILRGVVYGIICHATEYVTGWALKLSTGSCPWDYSSDSRWSVQGVIRVDYFPFFMILGWGLELVVPVLIL